MLRREVLRPINPLFTSQNAQRTPRTGSFQFDLRQRFGKEQFFVENLPFQFELSCSRHILFPFLRNISTSFGFSIPAIFPTFSRHFLGFRCGTGWRCRGNQLFSTNGRLKESLFQIPGDPWQNGTSGRSPGRSPDPASVREVVYIL
jgi:hypothetical protein